MTFTKTGRKLEGWSAIPLRMIVGYGFMAHGYAKVVKGPDHFIALLHAIGVPAPHLMGWATIVIEFAGGFAVLAGSSISFASVPMAAVLLVAMFTVHLQYGFSSVKLLSITAAGAQFGPPGFEIDLLYLACLAALTIGGPGALSVDGLLARRKKLSRTLEITKSPDYAGTCSR